MLDDGIEMRKVTHDSETPRYDTRPRNVKTLKIIVTSSTAAKLKDPERREKKLYQCETTIPNSTKQW